jgi:hypothetical protein
MAIAPPDSLLQPEAVPGKVEVNEQISVLKVDALLSARVTNQ